MIPRLATLNDAPFLAAIYNEGIEDRVATFETRPRSEEDVRGWFDERHPIVVVEEDGQIVAFASTSTYRPRDCYRGNRRSFRICSARISPPGSGTRGADELIKQAKAKGFWKLVSRVFPENQASRALIRSLGFREVGIYEKHGKLDGVWRDVVIVERHLLA